MEYCIYRVFIILPLSIFLLVPFVQMQNLFCYLLKLNFCRIKLERRGGRWDELNNPLLILVKEEQNEKKKIQSGEEGVKGRCIVLSGLLLARLSDGHTLRKQM